MQMEDALWDTPAYLLQEFPDLLRIFGSVDVPQGSRLFSAFGKALNRQLISIAILYGPQHFCRGQAPWLH